MTLSHVFELLSNKILNLIQNHIKKWTHQKLNMSLKVTKIIIEQKLLFLTLVWFPSPAITTEKFPGRILNLQVKISCSNLIERCLQLYMNRDEVVKTLLSHACIHPGFTSLVWQKLEEENAYFFRAYYIRLKLKKHIIIFNHLLEHQYHLMKYPMPPKLPMGPIQNRVHPMPVQLTTYPWDTQFYSNLQWGLQVSLIWIPWVCLAVMWSMESLLPVTFIPYE
uniref:Uncharacterized protein n=1 Tax=Lactuca sativa TaxID=4236 RepID=A0A9R1X9P4_LACSA|nr:hypothetical protein LSAT_V11C500240370 [Lactuca sativa]